MLPAYLHGISFELGKPESIETLSELRRDRDSLEILLATGMRDYLRSEADPLELARSSIRRTFAETGIDPSRIDLLVYVSESFPENGQLSEGMGHLCSDLGLINAFPIGVCLSTCGNMAAAIRIATAAISREKANNVLIVATDKVGPGQSRILPPAATVFSDAASSCIITSDPAKGHRIKGISLFADNGLWESGTLDMIANLGAAIRKVCTEALEEAGVSREFCVKLLMNNYNHTIQRLFCISSRFRREQLYLDTIGKYAHMGTSDTLINLDHYSRSDDSRRHGAICLLSTGPSMCGAVVLEKA